MILLRSTHEALLQQKDAQLAQLQEEVRWLRNFVQPVRSPRSLVTIPEADAILEGRQDQLSADTAESDEILAERDRVLSGTY